LGVLAYFYASTPGQGSALARLTGNTLGDRQMGRAQPPVRDSLVGQRPTATVARLLEALGYDVSSGRIDAAADAFRRDNGLPPGDPVDLALLTALLNAASRSTR
jgi:hypothetical protein